MHRTQHRLLSTLATGGAFVSLAAGGGLVAAGQRASS